MSFYLLVLIPSLRVVSFISLSFDTFASLSVLCLYFFVVGTTFSQSVPRAPPPPCPSATFHGRPKGVSACTQVKGIYNAPPASSSSLSLLTFLLNRNKSQFWCTLLVMVKFVRCHFYPFVINHGNTINEVDEDHFLRYPFIIRT